MIPVFYNLPSICTPPSPRLPFPFPQSSTSTVPYISSQSTSIVPAPSSFLSPFFAFASLIAIALAANFFCRLDVPTSAPRPAGQHPYQQKPYKKKKPTRSPHLSSQPPHHDPEARPRRWTCRAHTLCCEPFCAPACGSCSLSSRRRRAILPGEGGALFARGA